MSDYWCWRCEENDVRAEAYIARLTRERDEARAEIERLRAALRDGVMLMEVHGDGSEDDVLAWLRIARAALKDEP